MARKISIKTIDGGRFEIVDDGYELDMEEVTSHKFLSINLNGMKKTFNVANIVSITETEIGDA